MIEALADDLTGIRNHDEGIGLGIADEVPKLDRLTTMHRGHDDGLFVITVRTPRFEGRRTTMELLNDEITDRLRMLADDAEALAQIHTLDDIVHDQGLRNQSEDREESSCRSEHHEGDDHCGDECGIRFQENKKTPRRSMP